MKSFMICQMNGGIPDIPLGVEYHGFVLCDHFGQHGAYMFSGTDEQLEAISGLEDVLEIVRCSTTPENPSVLQASEFGQTVAGIAQINGELVALGLSPVNPAKVVRECIEQVYGEVSSFFNVENFDVAEIPG